MASLVLKMSVSLDGYVASADGSTDWKVTGRSDDSTSWVVETVSNAAAHLMDEVCVVVVTRPTRSARSSRRLSSSSTRTTVLGVEVQQFVDEPGEHRTLVPKVLGLSEQSEAVKRQWRRWNLEQWLALHAQHREPQDVEVARRLLKWASDGGLNITFGTAMNNPSMKFEHLIGSERVSVARLSRSCRRLRHSTTLPRGGNLALGWSA